MKRLMLMLSLIGLAVALTALDAGSKNARRGFVKPAVMAGARNSKEKPRISEAYGKLPLNFEANEGQTDGRVKFISRGAGYALFVTPDEAVMTLSKPQQTSQLPDSLGHIPQQDKAIQAVLRIKLAGGNAEARATGVDELTGKTNYFIGDDRTKWRTNVANYSKVKMQDVYPGIDLVYYGNQRQLEEDFVVAPGADPTSIVMKIGGADTVSIADGELVLSAGGGEVRLRKPTIYQETAEGRRDVAGGYALKGGREVTFEVAEYDKTRPLIIDPVLVYSTYLGGSGGDYGIGIAVDSSGNAYVTGFTFSTNFPGTSSSPIQSVGSSFDSVFVTEINAGGTALVYSTYLAGSGYSLSEGYGIAVDSSGNAYVTGTTESIDFPGTIWSPIQAAFGGGADAFVTKINAGGTALVYSTYLGGSSGEQGHGIAVDSSGNAYVTGATISRDFPGTSSSPIQSTCGGCAFHRVGSDAFVTEINAGGTALVYSTYLGTGVFADGLGIAVDPSGNAYVTGATNSTNFPGASSSPIQSTLGGSLDAFVTKINAGGTALVYSTYLGGSNDDRGQGIAVDSSGNAYVTGTAQSTNFPGTSWSPIQATCGGCHDAFVAEIFAGGTALVYSTYLGGGNIDYGFGIAVDPSGNAYVTGATESTDFPGTSSSPIQATCGGCGDAFVTKIGGSALVNTPVGSNVSLSPTGPTPAALTFSNVTQAGNTTLATSSGGASPPAGFQLGNPPTYLDLTTTALFSGPITVCINYSGITFVAPSELRLFHFESGSWVDTTTKLDSTSQVICGSVNSLSPFAVFQVTGGQTALSMGPQPMEGNLSLSAGTLLQTGYDFTMPGSHPAATVSFIRTTVTFAWSCVSGPGSGILVVSMADKSYAVAQSSSAWYPSGDQQSPLVYQGSTAVPNVCGGGLVTFKKGGTFSTGIFSTDAKDKVNVRWHYSGGGAGGWSGTQSVVP